MEEHPVFEQVLRTLLPGLAAFTFLCSVASAQLPQHTEVSDLQRYQPRQQVSGTIRVYGNNYIPALMKQWQEGFQKFQPGIVFTTNLPGTEAAMAGITSGIADISFFGLFWSSTPSASSSSFLG